MPDVVDIFVEPGMRKAARQGRHPFLNLVGEVLSEANLEPDFRHMAQRTEPDVSPLSLIHRKAPASPNGLVFRQSYHDPFWQIERIHERGKWDVAQANFDPSRIPEDRALRFQTHMRERLFPELSATKGDCIYVPLQGKLLQRRSFQRCAPIEMLRALKAATDRPIVATLHPGETYSNREIAAVRAILPVETGNMAQHLPSCAMVVTMNSSAAFNGYFFDKPVVLLANIDFHHIAKRATLRTLHAEIENGLQMQPEFAKYLWWFLQVQSINCVRPQAKEKIRQRLSRLGWPVGEA